jgi:hypothetical protein
MSTDEARRSRRRRRRLTAVAIFLIIALGLAWFFEKQAATIVYVVRYAERAVTDDPNPGLSAAGHQRARELARVLGKADVFGGVDAIFANQYRSSQETAEPIAKLLGLPVQILEADNIRGMRDMIKAEYRGKMVLVITNREPVQHLIARFDGRKNIPPMAEAEHDNLYVVSIPWYGKVDTLGLKYGEPYVP